jgi:hypothetical protein
LFEWSARPRVSHWEAAEEVKRYDVLKRTREREKEKREMLARLVMLVWEKGKGTRVGSRVWAKRARCRARQSVSR